MKIDFKFEIGQFVYIKHAVINFNDILKPLLDKSKSKDYISIGEHDLYRNSPAKWQIIERIAQECPSGIQLHYKVRVNMTIETFNEIELTDTLEEI